MYDVQVINILVLRGITTSSYRGFWVPSTEWPSCCSQPFIPVKLGAPLKLGFALEAGIISRLRFLSGLNLGRAFRRLLLRRLMASYPGSAVVLSGGKL